MKVLLINNFYYNRGGDCTYMFSLKKLLESQGHKTVVFSMNHPNNFDSEYSKYFVSYINYEEQVKNKSVSAAFQVASRTIYSTEASKNIAELIKAEKPDIAHIQNLHHHITPSIFHVLRDYKIPIIWTLHDYSVICPNTSFLAHGKICEKCRKRKYYWPVITKCKKNSFAASTMASVELLTHKIMRYYRQVDYFISPSMFLRDKLIEYGFSKDNIVHLNNFTYFSTPEKEKVTEDGYFMYLGRLSEEKGIKTLIDAANKVFSGDSTNSELSKCKLKIIGDGPIRDKIMYYARSKNTEHNVEFLGHKSHEEAMEILAGCKFLILPSEWYENFPYSVLEAFALGKPVIASRIGGISELVRNWETGLLFEPGNPEMLALKISFLLKHPEKARNLGRNAREFMSGDISPENHYIKLMDIYNRAIQK